MGSPRAPSMPTEKQIRQAWEVVRELCPGALIAEAGPAGVRFYYPGQAGASERGDDDEPFEA